jgi:hypothetical protein
VSEPWSLARVSEARAYWFDFHLLLWVTGEAPAPCYEVDLDQSLLDVEPPSFVARWRRMEGVCPEVITPYSYRETFKIGAKRDHVALHHAGDSLTVPVEDYAPDRVTGSFDETARSETFALSNTADPLSGALLPADEAVGYSNAWDLGEALREAARGLPPRRPDVADWLSRYEVVSIGAEIGGIAGLNRLFVRVRGG